MLEIFRLRNQHKTKRNEDCRDIKFGWKEKKQIHQKPELEARSEISVGWRSFKSKMGRENSLQSAGAATEKAHSQVPIDGIVSLKEPRGFQPFQIGSARQILWESDHLSSLWILIAIEFNDHN